MWLMRVAWFLMASALCGSAAIAQVFPVPEAGIGSAGPFDTRQEGIYTTAAVVLDGVTLFRVATIGPPAAGEFTAAARALQVDSVLQQIVAIDPDTGAPAWDAATLRVGVRHQKDQATIEVVDARHPTPMTIVTVTSADARYRQASVNDVADAWRQILQTNLARALRKREPDVERHHLVLVTRVLLGLVLATALVLVILRTLRRRTAQLTEELERRETSTEAKSPAATAADVPEHAAVRRRALAAALRTAAPWQRLKWLQAFAALLVWLLLLAWFITVTWALGLFPQTTPLATALSRGGTAIGVIWFATGLLNRLGDLLISRISAEWRIRHYPNSEERARAMLRVPTIASALAGFKAFILITLAGFLTLGQLGLPIGSVVTIGSVVALAITFATQNFLRDFVGGLTVLFEDQYAVGDFVTINGHTGLVERLTLRMVQVRDPIGSVVTIAHGAVTAAANHSRDWSRIDYRVSIDPAADPQAAIECIRVSLDELAQDPNVRGSLLLPIEWIGVDGFTRDWTLIRASIRTAPLRQFELRRRINEHVRRRLGEAGIGYGPPIPAEFISLV
ncbi:MAG: MscS Mechanosensitive ion channel [Candidatus Eremiobacteraeota bacterium]|nr:MscS Mechanosensitive ion channel [Candidatus Eremiobacteraeota bacterium]